MKRSKSKQKILDVLKQEGPKDPIKLGKILKITPMAVRQHLYDLKKEKIVDFVEEARPTGRPAKLWGLTEKSMRFFPDAHADLVTALIGNIKKELGGDALEKIIRARADEQRNSYKTKLKGIKSLAGKLNKLAQIRSEEGYMAEYKQLDENTYLFIENHCPICSAANECQQFCAEELETFQALLPAPWKMTRKEHILNKKRRCTYEIRKQ